MDQNTYNKRKLLGICPYDNEMTDIRISIDNKYCLNYKISLADMYNSRMKLSDILYKIIEVADVKEV